MPTSTWIRACRPVLRAISPLLLLAPLAGHTQASPDRLTTLDPEKAKALREAAAAAPSVPLTVTPEAARAVRQHQAREAQRWLEREGADPGPLGRGRATGSLNRADLNALPGCQGGSALMKETLDLLKTVARSMGGSFDYDRACGTFQRELAMGVELVPVAPKPRWDRLGGSGQAMADGLLCLAKDLGQATDGRVVNQARTATGTRVVQTLGLSKWDPERKRAELYHLVEVCAPMIGCFDAQRQAITLERRASDPTWPRPVRVGDYVVASSHAVETGADWSSTTVKMKLPQIRIPTPYGVLAAQPQFDYRSAMLPVDTPFYARGQERARVLGNILHPFNVPGSGVLRRAVLEDAYGRGGVPFILNAVSNLDLPGMPAGAPIALDPGDPDSPRLQPQSCVGGWSSQLAFGGRGLSPKARQWNRGTDPSSAERPDFDFDAIRSPLEQAPAAHFDAAAAFRYTLPTAPEGIPVSRFSLTITVTPRLSGDFAAQFQMYAREGMLDDACRRQGEFRSACGMAQAGMLTGSQVRNRADLDTRVELFVDFGLPFVPNIDFDKTYTINLADDYAAAPSERHAVAPVAAHDPARRHWSGVAHVAQDAPDDVFWQAASGFSGAVSRDLSSWIDACMKTPGRPRDPPPPAHEPGDPQDIAPPYLPCNICIANDDPRANFEPVRLYEVAARAPGADGWRCEAQQNAGCFDLCSYESDTGRFLRVERSPIQFMGADGQRCRAPKRDRVK